MQVLLALFQAKGAIVTRDELIELCWDGRIIGEDAINRAISRLRKAAAEVGGQIIRVETLNKVGYRLVIESNEPQPFPGGGTAVLPEKRGRRTFPFGAVALGVAAVLSLGEWKNRAAVSRAPPPGVASLLQQARKLAGQNTREAQYHAIGVLQRAVELAPDYARSWGLLGISYGLVSHDREGPERTVLRDGAEAAAARSLELEPGNPLGEVAYSAALPIIGQYLKRDAHQLRALQAEPRNYEAVTHRAATLQCVGRLQEALATYACLPQGPLTPADHASLIRALWSAGRLDQANQEMTNAASLYPFNATIWFTRLNIYLYTGQYSTAIAMTQDAQEAPGGIDEQLVSRVRILAEAMIDSNEMQRVEIVRNGVDKARNSAIAAELAIRDAGALGQLDAAFAITHAYYFNEGFIVPDFATPGSGSTPDLRQTRLLFEPVLASFRSDPRFAVLLDRLGLDRYWRDSGKQPDFRAA